MPFSIYTYSNPYEINKELYWDFIKNCPHFCVSQTMANGMIETYEEMTAGKVSTVGNLVNSLFPYWESTECKIKQYNGLTETNRYCRDQILKMHIHILIFIWYAK